MAKDDYHVIVYQILSYLYQCLKSGEDIDTKRLGKDSEYFTVAMHGSASAVGFGTTEANMSPRLLASIIRHSDGWNGQKIRLLSCSTGKQIGDDYCFAEELANALGVEVKAPNDTLFVFPSGNMYVGEDRDGRMVPFLPNQRKRRK